MARRWAGLLVQEGLDTEGVTITTGFKWSLRDATPAAVLIPKWIGRLRNTQLSSGLPAPLAGSGLCTRLLLGWYPRFTQEVEADAFLSSELFY